MTKRQEGLQDPSLGAYNCPNCDINFITPKVELNPPVA